MQARTKLVTFRLSEEEYEHLRAVSEAHGARSVSEFVRSGVGWIVENCERRLWEVLVTSGQRPMPPVAGARRALTTEDTSDKI
jgi:hypothetical protein